jgi:nucleoside-diphosphate-sugar epimerase
LGAINYVDVRDVADIAVNLLFSEIHDERFIINGGQTTYLNLLSQMAASFGKRPPKYKVTPWIAELAWRLAYLQSLFTGKAPFITRESVRVADKAFYYENDKIKNALNFRFRALEDTIQWACEQLKANTDLPQSAK